MMRNGVYVGAAGDDSDPVEAYLDDDDFEGNFFYEEAFNESFSANGLDIADPNPVARAQYIFSLLAEEAAGVFQRVGIDPDVLPSMRELPLVGRTKPEVRMLRDAIPLNANEFKRIFTDGHTDIVDFKSLCEPSVIDLPEIQDPKLRALHEILCSDELNHGPLSRLHEGIIEPTPGWVKISRPSEKALFRYTEAKPNEDRS